MRKFFSLFITFTLSFVIFHFHSDFQYHQDCPACVFEVDDDKSINLDIDIKPKKIVFFISKKISYKVFYLKKIQNKNHLSRAPPSKS